MSPPVLNDQLVPWRMGYVVINVKNVEAATILWTRHAMLEVSERTDDAVYLRGGTDHHWVVLRQNDGPEGLGRMAFEVEKREDLDAFRDRLKEEGVHVTEHGGDWTGDALRFTDPNGYEVELFDAMGNVGIEPTRPWVNPSELLHTVVGVSDLDESFDFWTRVLGFRESDRVLGRTVFLRTGNGFHHALVIGVGRGEPPFLDHVAFHCRDIDDLMRIRQLFVARDMPMGRDVLRHPTSGSMGFYAKGIPGPDSVEFCIEHARIIDPGYRPRTMAPGRWTSNVWVPPAELLDD